MVTCPLRKRIKRLKRKKEKKKNRDHLYINKNLKHCHLLDPKFLVQTSNGEKKEYVNKKN
jgi:hypothetical protein